MGSLPLAPPEKSHFPALDLQWLHTIISVNPRLFCASGKALQALVPLPLQMQLQALPAGITGPATLLLLMGGSVCSG